MTDVKAIFVWTSTVVRQGGTGGGGGGAVWTPMLDT